LGDNWVTTLRSSDEGQEFLLTARKTPLQFVKFAGGLHSDMLSLLDLAVRRKGTLLAGSTPNAAAQENGARVWGRRQSRWLRAAGGFAVYLLPFPSQHLY
jgi:hypothetical protein